MTKENFTIYFSTFISGILITMFISALVTYLAISDIQFFFSVWPQNWFFAALVAFPTILFVKPISQKITQKIVNIIFYN
tara:strand:- start:1157 stop:1393 length:237 start_codon:yes stop_codon:yes gene_type:complete